MVVEEVDTTALGLYLAITYQDKREELVQLGLDTVVQKRKHPKAKKILITTEEATEAEAKTESKFHPQEQQPTREQTPVDGQARKKGGIGLVTGHNRANSQEKCQIGEIDDWATFN